MRYIALILARAIVLAAFAAAKPLKRSHCLPSHFRSFRLNWKTSAPRLPTSPDDIDHEQLRPWTKGTGSG